MAHSVFGTFVISVLSNNNAFHLDAYCLLQCWGGVVVRVVVSFCYWPSGTSGFLSNMTEGHFDTFCFTDWHKWPSTTSLLSNITGYFDTFCFTGWHKWPSATSLLWNMTGHFDTFYFTGWHKWPSATRILSNMTGHFDTFYFTGWHKWPSATSLLANMTEGHLCQKDTSFCYWLLAFWQIWQKATYKEIQCQKASTRRPLVTEGQYQNPFPWRQTPPLGKDMGPDRKWHHIRVATF